MLVVVVDVVVSPLRVVLQSLERDQVVEVGLPFTYFLVILSCWSVISPPYGLPPDIFKIQDPTMAKLFTV